MEILLLFSLRVQNNVIASEQKKHECSEKQQHTYMK